MAQIPYLTSPSFDGASNAQDFQPLTRNPQNIAPYTQQETGSGLQDPAGMDGLYDNNVEISVVSSGQSQVLSDVVEPKSSNHWPAFLVLIILAVIAVAIIHRLLQWSARKS